MSNCSDFNGNCAGCLTAQKQTTRLQPNYPYSYCYYNDGICYPKYQENPDSDEVRITQEFNDYCQEDICEIGDYNSNPCYGYCRVRSEGTDPMNIIGNPDRSPIRDTSLICNAQPRPPAPPPAPPPSLPSCNVRPISKTIPLQETCSCDGNICSPGQYCFDTGTVGIQCSDRPVLCHVGNRQSNHPCVCLPESRVDEILSKIPDSDLGAHRSCTIADDYSYCQQFELTADQVISGDADHANQCINYQLTDSDGNVIEQPSPVAFITPDHICDGNRRSDCRCSYEEKCNENQVCTSDGCIPICRNNEYTTQKCACGDNENCGETGTQFCRDGVCMDNLPSCSNNDITDQYYGRTVCSCNGNVCDLNEVCFDGECISPSDCQNPTNWAHYSIIPSDEDPCICHGVEIALPGQYCSWYGPGNLEPCPQSRERSWGLPCTAENGDICGYTEYAHPGSGGCKSEEFPLCEGTPVQQWCEDVHCEFDKDVCELSATGNTREVCNKVYSIWPSGSGSTNGIGTKCEYGNVPGGTARPGKGCSGSHYSCHGNKDFAGQEPDSFHCRIPEGINLVQSSTCDTDFWGNPDSPCCPNNVSPGISGK